MNRRTAVVYITSAFIAGIIILSGYFFFKKTPERATSKRVDVGSKVILFRDVKYSGEKKGVVDWEIRAKLLKKHIDTTMVEMDGVEGRYTPKPDTTVTFKAAMGQMDTEKEVGSVEQVEIYYKGEYVIKSPSMAFDFKKSLAHTAEPVDLSGKKFTMKGLGLTADTEHQIITVDRDVTGTIEEERGVMPSRPTDSRTSSRRTPIFSRVT
jgi:LPS export ABC transporter protein LptC